MLKPQNISFFRLMTAGYISAETYRALYPKKYFCELTKDECLKYGDKANTELSKLFDNKNILERLYCLERLEEELSADNESIINMLDSCLVGATYFIKVVIEKIGKHAFLYDYIFCEEKYFNKLNFVDTTNQFKLKSIGEEFARVFMNTYCNCCRDGAIDSSFLNDSSEIAYSSHKRYFQEDHVSFAFKIDVDAISDQNKRYRKYVEYLARMEWDRFRNFAKLLQDTINEMSVRSRNCVYSIDAKNFYVNYLFADKHKLLNVRGLGTSSMIEISNSYSWLIKEVVEECNRLEEKDLEQLELNEEEQKIQSEKTLIEKIGEVKYSKLCLELESLKQNLSVRSRNGIENYHGDFLEDFVDKDKEIRSLSKIGKKSEIELSVLIKQLKKSLNSTLELTFSKEELHVMENEIKYGLYFDDFSKHFLSQYNRVPLLRVLGNCLQSLLMDNKIQVLNDVAPIFDNKEGEKTETVASKYNISRERVRQLCNQGINCLDKNEVKETIKAFEDYYKILSSKDWLLYLSILSTKDAWSINDIKDTFANEESSLSAGFIVFVFNMLFADNYAIVGKTPYSIKARSNGWNNSYLVKNEIVESFDFNLVLAEIADFENNSTCSISKSAQELVLDTLYNAWKDYDFSKVESIALLTSKILIEELNIIPDINGEFLLEGKKKESPEDFVYNVLSQYGAPLEIESIFEEMKKAFPGKFQSSYVVRRIAQKDPRICLLGVDNKVTLTEWKHIEIGGIRELIVAFLSDSEDPQHINTIVNYIIEKRNTTPQSIRSTMGSGKQFQRFSRGYWGLHDRKYKDWFYYSEATQNAIERLDNLSSFINQNNRFPHNSSEDPQEKNLAIWWKRFEKQDDFHEVVKQKITEIKAQYSHLLNKKDKDWFDYCKEYEIFLVENKRKPDGLSNREIVLKEWYEKAFSDISEGILSSDKESAFINLSTLL